MQCKVCDRPMRPGRAKPDDYPGTVKAAHKTACQSCVNRGKAEVSGKRYRIRWGEHCKACDTPMRPETAAPTVATAGWVAHKGRGICHQCADARSRGYPRRRLPEDNARFTPPGLASVDADVRRMSRDLDDWLRDRRNRGVPHEGTGAQRPSPRQVVLA